jgi:hypothetical protein
MFDKQEIMPKVMIYKNCFNDVEKILNIIKKTEKFPENNNRGNWEKWGNFGIICQEKKYQNKNISKNQEKPGTFFYEEKKMINEIYKVFYDITKDYIKDWSQIAGWPDYINTWDLENNHWSDGQISFCKYDPTGDTKYAMDYHTDNHEYKNDSRGKKFIITFTVYLNDDYEGGEISFLNESSGLVIDYKPKAGDITVFPSGHPYYHGVFKVKENNKYLLRMFWFWDYEGSLEWLENEKKFKKDVWEKMEQKKAEEVWNSGLYHRYVVEPGEKEIEGMKSLPFFKKSSKNI